MKKLPEEAWENMLAQMERDGVGLYLEGRRTNTEEICRACCAREDVTYMPDFVTDEEGNLKEVRYDEVKGW